MTEERFDGTGGDATRESPWWGVHVSRYLFAASRVSGTRGLDVACGTGYGLPILRAEGRLVIGADADFGSALKARRSAAAAPVTVADGTRLPFATGAFDFVTSFETLEHLHDRDGFLDEIRRVLARGGICMLSTPNALVTEPVNGKPRNPYHVHEYTPEELVSALQARFDTVELHGQILSPRFAISPFWDDQRRLPPTLAAQSKLFVWRVLNRMPASLRDGASRAIWGHQLIPTERDYELTTEIASAPVLVAVCTVRAQALKETA